MEPGHKCQLDNNHSQMGRQPNFSNMILNYTDIILAVLLETSFQCDEGSFSHLWHECYADEFSNELYSNIRTLDIDRRVFVHVHGMCMWVQLGSCQLDTS